MKEIIMTMLLFGKEVFMILTITFLIILIILLISVINKIDKTNKNIYKIKNKQIEIENNINDIKDTQNLIKIKIDKYFDK